MRRQTTRPLLWRPLLAWGCLLLPLLLLVLFLSLPQQSCEARIYRYPDYTLWPVRVPGQESGRPEQEVEEAQWTRSRNGGRSERPHSATTPIPGALRRLLVDGDDDTVQDDQDANRGDHGSGSGGGGGGRSGGGDDLDRRRDDEWYLLTMEEALAKLDASESIRPRTRYEKLPMHSDDPTNTTAQDKEKLPWSKPIAKAALDRRAQISVSKLNLWDALPESDAALVQHGHVVKLSNPFGKFSFFPPKDGCPRAERPWGELERPSSNAKRNRCRVATNAGFFNTRRPSSVPNTVRHCYGGLVERGGKLVQKAHTRLRSRQFRRTVHFGITSSGHFFVGYLTDEQWRRHVKQPSQSPLKPSDESREPTSLQAPRGTDNRLPKDLDDSSFPPVSPYDFSAEERSPIEYETLAPRNTSWTFETLIGGALWLVRDGRPYVMESIVRDREDMRAEQSECERSEKPLCDADASGYRRAEHFVHLSAARTAIGHTEDGSLVILSLDGSPSHDLSNTADTRPEDFERSGVTLRDMASLLVRMGVVNAINLDGGGSASVVLDGVVANFPSDTRALGEGLGPMGYDHIAAAERPVSTITCVHDDDEDEEGNVVELDPDTGHVIPRKNSTTDRNNGNNRPPTEVVGSEDFVLVNATEQAHRLSEAVRLAEEEALARSRGREAEAQARYSRSLFLFSVLVPVLGVALFVSLLCFVYFACSRGWMSSSSQRAGGDSSSDGLDLAADAEAGGLAGGDAASGNGGGGVVSVPRLLLNGRARKGGFRPVGAEGDSVDSMSAPTMMTATSAEEGGYVPMEAEHHARLTPAAVPARSALSPSLPVSLSEQQAISGTVEVSGHSEDGMLGPEDTEECRSSPPFASVVGMGATTLTPSPPSAARSALAASSLESREDLAINGPLAHDGALLAEADALAARLAQQNQRQQKQTRKERKQFLRADEKDGGKDLASAGGLLTTPPSSASSAAAVAAVVAAAKNAHPGARFELGVDLDLDDDDDDGEELFEV
jgi:hypothetical protein